MVERLWALLDQVASSVTNVLVVVLAARWLSPRDFGSFSLIFGAVVLGSGLVRTAVVEPFFVTRKMNDQSTYVPKTAFALGLLLGAIGSTLAFLIGYPETVNAGQLTTLAIGVPAIATFESLRLLEIRNRRPRSALNLNLVWLVGTASGLAVESFRPHSEFGLLLAWVLPPVGVAMAYGVRHGLTFDRFTRRLALENKRLAMGFSTDYLMGFGSQQAAALALVGVLTLAEVGSYRLALTWFGPLGILFAGLSPIVLAQRLDSLEQSSWGLKRFSMGLGFAAMLFTAGSLAVPEASELVLGQTGASGLQPLILPTGAALTASGLAAGASLGLRELARASRLATVRVGLAPIAIGFPLAGGSWGGAVGASWGFAAFSGTQAAALWLARSTAR